MSVAIKQRWVHGLSLIEYIVSLTCDDFVSNIIPVEYYISSNRGLVFVDTKNCHAMSWVDFLPETSVVEMCWRTRCVKTVESSLLLPIALEIISMSRRMCSQRNAAMPSAPGAA